MSSTYRYEPPPSYAATSADLNTNANYCPRCCQPVVQKEDKFCRTCGFRTIQCAWCHTPLRITDRFCGKCGARRYYWFELWRNGILHRSPTFVGAVCIGAGVAWLTIYYLLRRSSR
ncbi:hypothetical protein AB6A40_000383 [Gnathostoma spinigerum]|uniref:DZANK-type domain-containing protein n=1 Tax=Gnathostoma spinigerum TaxID=75299 RepID=A0ABD6E6C1_9BILA